MLGGLNLTLAQNNCERNGKMLTVKQKAALRRINKLETEIDQIKDRISREWGRAGLTYTKISRNWGAVKKILNNGRPDLFGNINVSPSKK